MSDQTTVTVNWEAIKVLAVAVGVREAARRMGISEETVKKRCTREGWLSDPAIREATARSVELRSNRHTVQVPNASPAQAMAMELAQLGAETRVGFARAMAGVARHVTERAPEENLADASNVKAAAQTAGLVHSWADQQPGSKVRLEVLLSKPEPTSIDIQSEVVEAEWNDDGATPI